MLPSRTVVLIKHAVMAGREGRLLLSTLYLSFQAAIQGLALAICVSPRPLDSQGPSTRLLERVLERYSPISSCTGWPIDATSSPPLVASAPPVPIQPLWELGATLGVGRREGSGTNSWSVHSLRDFEQATFHRTLVRASSFKRVQRSWLLTVCAAQPQPLRVLVH